MHKITFFRQKLDSERFAASRNEERYCFFILAHIFNELSLLQRWAFITSKAETQDGVEGSGNLMQTLFIARLFMAKLFEADVIIRKRYVQDFLHLRCFPQMDGRGEELVEQIRVLLNDNPWVRDLRNQQAFHYPRINQLAPALDDPNMVWEIDLPRIEDRKHAVSVR